MGLYAGQWTMAVCEGVVTETRRTPIAASLLMEGTAFEAVTFSRKRNLTHVAEICVPGKSMSRQVQTVTGGTTDASSYEFLARFSMSV